jgi:D-alanyl-D-alanine dipeptidase
MYILSLLAWLVGDLMAFYPNEFESLSEICPSILIEASYATKKNFTGEVVHGYKTRKVLLSKNAAVALCKVQEKAISRGYSLKVFDGYRPVKAVSFFQSWAKLPENNLELKQMYYPSYTREELFQNGYISNRSSHSRGSAVDLTLVSISNLNDLDMGSSFDYFNDISHTENSKIKKYQLENRLILKDLMEQFGFKNYTKEWWHYSFLNESFPDNYFDFDIE